MGGRGSSGLRASDPLNRIRNQEYQYHATTGRAVFAIYEEGLKPNRGHAGAAVYFAPDEQGALDWTESSSTGGKTLLRVKTQTLKDKYDWGVIDESESTADKKISSKDIEIRTGGGNWISMKEYTQKYYNSYRFWKLQRGKR